MSPEQTMWAIKASKSKANKALKVIICHKKKQLLVQYMLPNMQTYVKRGRSMRFNRTSVRQKEPKYNTDECKCKNISG